MTENAQPMPKSPSQRRQGLSRTFQADPVQKRPAQWLVKQSRSQKIQLNKVLTHKKKRGIPLAFYQLMTTCLQDVQEINYKEKEVKESYYPAVQTYAIIKIPRRKLI